MLGRKSKGDKRIDEERLNNQGCLMKIVEYIDSHNIVVEFQDEYKAKVHTQYVHFQIGNVNNPYRKTICNKGVVGDKYPCKIKHKHTKEYIAWRGMLLRSFDEKTKIEHPTYKDVTCCEEWLYYPNFYEWLHTQKNFDKWLSGEKWAVDKDILIKGNKVYSPDTCCLVPMSINTIFAKKRKTNNDLPTGVRLIGECRYQVYCCNLYANKQECLGTYSTIEEAFYTYKIYKESYIKQVAQDEYSKGNITKECYEAMLRYEVEITD